MFPGEGSGFSVAAEYVDDLVGDHILDCLTGGFEILPGIEVIRMFRKVLADRSGHGKANVRVDIDLADSAARSLAELFFRNTNGTGHIAAVFIDFSNEFLRN